MGPLVCSFSGETLGRHSRLRNGDQYSPHLQDQPVPPQWETVLLYFPSSGGPILLSSDLWGEGNTTQSEDLLMHLSSGVQDSSRYNYATKGRYRTHFPPASSAQCYPQWRIVLICFSKSWGPALLSLLLQWGQLVAPDLNL